LTWGPYNNYYFLTLDTIGSLNDAMTTMNFKTSTGYLFDYYIPNFGLGTKQPISATRANTIALYTTNGTTVHKRSLTTGAVLATAAIPGGSAATGFFGGRKLPNNAGIDIDNCGNVYVGSSNQLVKFDQNLVQLSTVATPFPIYDVDVSIGGDVAVCGFAAGTGYVRAIAMTACAQVTPICLPLVLPVTLSSFEVNCNNNKAEIEWVTETEKNNSYFKLLRSEDGMNFEEIQKISGNGNSNHQIKYKFTDERPHRGTSYYQLIQTDLNGEEHKYDIIEFNNNCSALPFELNAFPNPFTNQLNIELNLESSSIVTVELFNNQGQKIKNLYTDYQLAKGKHTLKNEGLDVAPSLYFLRVSVNNQTSVIKVVK
jgi:hypothetical protein